MIETDIRELNEKIQRESQFLDLINLEMNKVIVGQKQMTERLLIGLLANGHILLEDVDKGIDRINNLLLVVARMLQERLHIVVQFTLFGGQFAYLLATQ